MCSLVITESKTPETSTLKYKLMTNQFGTPMVQGFGHAQFRDGFRCALYRDDDGNIYAKPELFTINEMIMFHDAWVHIDPMNSDCCCTTCNQSKQ